MKRKSLLASFLLAGSLAICAPASANEHRAPMVPVHEYGIAKLDHLNYHLQWTGFAVSEGIRTQSVGRFLEIYRAQTVCADDLPTGLLFTPGGMATLGMVALSGALLFGRSRSRRQRSATPVVA